MRHNAPHTFTAKGDAEAWLNAERRLIETESWTAPHSRNTVRVPTFAEYAASWMQHRDLRPRTRVLYEGLLDRHLLPSLGDLPLTAISPARVRHWHNRVNTGPTAKAHAYSLLRTILRSAMDDELIERVPTRIRGAGTAKSARKAHVLTPEQVDAAAQAIQPRFRALVLVTAWCGLRQGEALELRRKDVERLPGGTYVIHVRRAVGRVRGDLRVGLPKTDAGLRDVAVPPHVTDTLTHHLAEHTGPDAEALLWPAARDPEAHLSQSTLAPQWARAAEAAGAPGTRWHDLRHTGATLAAIAGATVPELMTRIGHSTPAAALRYQHAAQGRDAEIAEALSRLANPSK
ncbi:tyrosine-type recombinase/integrase [Kytococcus aerolatus]|uniref:tyrosine-type recombinase/integrase n=1 Tax=Kytococcus aerolatus TaxID=592308 RepID=UPI001F28CFC1|nr:site-specific integrase [Kytococcus aerolatus]